MTKQRPRNVIPDDDSLWVALQNAPIDVEPVTEEDLQAIAEARAEYARGELISAEVVRAELFGDIPSERVRSGWLGESSTAAAPGETSRPSRKGSDAA